MAVDGRQAALDNALKQIEKDFGKGAIKEIIKEFISNKMIQIREYIIKNKQRTIFRFRI